MYKYLISIILATTLIFSVSCVTSNKTNLGSLTGNTQGKYQKPGAPINIKYSTIIVPNIGDMIDVNIEFFSNLGANNSIKINMTTNDKLELHRVSNNIIFKQGEDLKVDFTVYSKELGKEYINVFTGYYTNDKLTSSRVFAIPVQTGENPTSKLQKSNDKQINGNLLIINHADTTVY